jgi:hypothetical protein
MVVGFVWTECPATTNQDHGIPPKSSVWLLTDGRRPGTRPCALEAEGGDGPAISDGGCILVNPPISCDVVVEAFIAEGFETGLYLSLISDGREEKKPKQTR